jgi:hypothetical protein
VIKMDGSDGDFGTSGRLHRIEIAADRNRLAAVKTSILLAIGGDKALAAATERGVEASHQRAACTQAAQRGCGGARGAAIAAAAAAAAAIAT